MQFWKMRKLFAKKVETYIDSLWGGLDDLPIYLFRNLVGCFYCFLNIFFCMLDRYYPLFVVSQLLWDYPVNYYPRRPNIPWTPYYF
ncbi:MAG: hypothetical protein QXH84_01820 [Thermosphaera sp.]